MLLEGAVLFLVLWLLVHRGKWLRTPGLIAGAFAVGYGSFRIFAEFFREPDAQLGFLPGGLTMGMVLSVPMVVAGLAVIFWKRRRHAPVPASGGASIAASGSSESSAAAVWCGYQVSIAASQAIVRPSVVFEGG